MNMAIFWAILLVVFVAVEACTVSMVSIWFAFGAVGAMIASLLGGEIWLQAVVFGVVSGIMLALLRPLSQKVIKPRIQPTNVDALVGAIVLVEETVGPMNGRVKLGDVSWSARYESGTLEPGTYAKVEKVQGAKLFVVPAKIAVEAK